ncbi:hypothetical protein HTSR_1714 [Halodesulfurarchaeum formicicum]|uniref:DUF1638 domain-containing protein n=1 Tax=Halodesulfurarchaeum formicicum TaxID=1873524 RepID=A0A1D8S6A4_9EURY|nr:DUF1638 domain-containing protein [Halodesulfurarchaeum formicicum]AOW80884.1 hypothetical protein HTSR_1714 [Halodesulfurarchaeum formicicum]
MHGIVACETLYPEIPRLAPDAAVAYVPQWYHEFPIHTPESETAHELLQERIDELESQGVDSVTVVYHDPEALEGLQTESVPLHVYRGRDCIELHLDQPPSGPGGERKDGGTYYLTRGWIDVAVDSYKVFTAYAGTLNDLVERFEEAERADPDMRVSWPKSEKIQQAAARSEHMGTDPAKLLRQVIGTYRHVVLVDTGLLTPFHHEYAEDFRDFLANDIPADEPREVSLTVETGTTEPLEAILTAPTSVSEVRTVEPGTPVPAEPGFRTGPQHP